MTLSFSYGPNQGFELVFAMLFDSLLLKFRLVLVFLFVSATTFAQEKTMDSQQKEKQLRIVKSKENKPFSVYEM